MWSGRSDNKNKQAVMCHGLFIELIADIKKPTVKVGFFLGFLARE
ncbi:hypothetical protein ECDEC10B_3359 [Escherichia coli DEC10B]|nr:hypothetical protein ECDEC10A_3087 [Escherichia coli DEC10A]EHW68451.1 hypothetical protein ECDEC10B_3359 [Escherichia coli DEC10B]